jgi:DNA-binding GntR family transcriptional regulator
VSLSPVREALQRLSGQGLILLRPARTAVVAPLDAADLEEIYRLRGLIEVDALTRAAPLLQDAQLEQILHRDRRAVHPQPARSPRPAARRRPRTGRRGAGGGDRRASSFQPT